MSRPLAPHRDVPSLQATAGVILAAGESSRMGTDKALLMYRGRTFLENIICQLRDAGVQRVVVVLGHHADLIQQSIDLTSVEVVVNRDYRLGQTSSLQAGLRRLSESRAESTLLCLVDHPSISVDTIQKLIQYFTSSGSPVIVPQLRGKHGHPVLLGRELFSQILSLGPGQGADTLIHHYHDRTEFVEVTDPGILLDVDDPESYRWLAE
ncbi:MAG: nucleotidyltransferase family protein [Acidobacteria bacterium]|nr:MAG: nucleotidyltransferase family protein [Acidobacteriota bacterium]